MGLDEPGEAIKWLARAVELRDPFLMFLKVDPKWKNLRQDARFIRLLNRMNLWTARESLGLPGDASICEAP